jgi:hypothetical protein
VAPMGEAFPQSVVGGGCGYVDRASLSAAIMADPTALSRIEQVHRHTYIHACMHTYTYIHRYIDT